ncbi:unnamed protein product [Adineta steineri]|uniref:Roadblock/LAMTOR2 domain-containing protein n=1 Tax=Adineta steineri TaxID=433720 RepID=A0A815BIU9_9BILA|nr:unnamed protein product [Adineta steineri]
MLKPKALSEVLAQVTNGGIQSTVLLTRDGALLAYSGFEAKDAKIIAAMASSIFAAHQRVRQTPGAALPQNVVGSGDLNMILLDAEVRFEAKDAKIIAAMASSIFAAHQRVRQTPGAALPQNVVGSGDLNMILLDAEEGKMAIAAVATQLVCMVSKTNVQLGMLKAKMDALSSYLQEPLRQVSQSNN